MGDVRSLSDGDDDDEPSELDGLGAMTVRHVLLTCPQWTSLREEYIRPLRSTNLGTILNSAKGCDAAVRVHLTLSALGTV